MLKKTKKSKFNEKDMFRYLFDKCNEEGSLRGVDGLEEFKKELKIHFPEKLKKFLEWKRLEKELKDWIVENTTEDENTLEDKNTPYYCV